MEKINSYDLNSSSLYNISIISVEGTDIQCPALYCKLVWYPCYAWKILDIIIITYYLIFLTMFFIIVEL